MLELRPLKKEDIPLLWTERFLARPNLRTPRLMPVEDQEKFYDTVVCNRDSCHYYYAVVDSGTVVGVTGLTYIDWINSRAEISLLIYSDYRKLGLGSNTVKLILKEGFENLGLHAIYGECYKINSQELFWLIALDSQNYSFHETTLPCTKLWNGKYYDSLFFTIWREQCSESCSESFCHCRHSEALSTSADTTLKQPVTA